MRLTILLAVLVGVVLVPEVNGWGVRVRWRSVARTLIPSIIRIPIPIPIPCRVFKYKCIHPFTHPCCRRTGKRDAVFADINEDGFVDQSEAMRLLDERDANEFLSGADENGLWPGRATMHRTGDVDDSPKRKPEIILYYNSTKSGVDTLDQMAHRYSVKRRTKRWPLVIFMSMIDIAGIASYVPWTTKFPGWKSGSNDKRRWFLQNVAEGLMLKQIKKTRSMLISRQLQSDIRAILPQADEPGTSDDNTEPAKRRRCCICSSKKSSKSQQICRLCNPNP